MTLLEQLDNIKRQQQGAEYKSLAALCAEAAAEIRRLQAQIDRTDGEPSVDTYDPRPF